MSQLLDSLLTAIGDPNRDDLLQVAVPRVHARIRELGKEQQLELRREVTEAIRVLSRETPEWWSHQIVFQYVWHLTHRKAEETPEQRALREQMQSEYTQRNGDWYAAGTWLTAEEAGERISRRTVELSKRAAPMRVEVRWKAEWQFGLIQRKHRGNNQVLAELDAAYYAIVAELRAGHANIWSIASDHDPDAFVYFYPPLQGHFRKIDEQKVAIIAFTEMEPEIPGGNHAE